MPRDDMTTNKARRRSGCFVFAVIAAALMVIAISSLWVFMLATATPLHPDANRVPSVIDTDPKPQWSVAVVQAQKMVRAALAEQNLPGLSVAVGVDDEIVWAEGFGWADIETKETVTPETRFRIGTASIALTSAAVGLLLESDRLKLDDQIQLHVPEFPEKQWPVNLRQLMGHIAGIRTDGGDEGPLFSMHCERPVDALSVFAERPLLFEPGTEFRHSSYGWILVSAAVESAAQKPFHEFMRQQVFDPLGLQDTAADSSTAAKTDRATSYFPRFAADPNYGPDVMRDIDLSGYAGAGVFVSTPSDLVRFGMAMNHDKLLKPETVRLLQAPQLLRSGQETDHGLGWTLKKVIWAGKPQVAIGIDGEILGGSVASLWLFPDRELVVAVVSNESYADTPTIAQQIAAAFARE